MSGSEIPTPPLPPPKPTKCSEAEALTSLEDHRCAICNKILINACRIDCGHTFCRHCLNVDRETRNERGKATCFVCDAAVTEISQNTEKDKEIDKLYASLSIDDQLKRARTKAERKAEEESFANDKPNRERLQREGLRNRACSSQDSRESFGSGDASASLNGDVAGAAWRESYGNDNELDEHDNPTYYCSGTYFWPEDGRDSHDQETYILRPDGDEGSSSNDEVNGRNPDFQNFSQSQPPQIVIHHTVQHVIHTVELREERRDTPVPGEDFRQHRRDRESFEEWDRCSEQFFGPPRYREHYSSSPSPPIPIPNDCHRRNNSQIPVYAQREFYSPYGAQSAPHPSFTGDNYRGHRRPASFAYMSAGGFPNHQPLYANASSNRSSECYGRSEEFGDDTTEDEGDFRRCESLCDFHRAMLEEEQRELEENLRAHSSRSSLHYELNEEDIDGGEDSEYENENSLEHEIVTVNVTIPIIPVSDTHGRRREQGERRSSCHCPPSSSRHSLVG